VGAVAAEALAVAAVAVAVASPRPADQKRLEGGKRKRKWTLMVIEMRKESEMSMATT
jgi:hypothetical protein